MAFFGLTLLNGGVVNPFHNASASTTSYPFHTIDDQVYLDAFHQYALPSTPTNQLLDAGEPAILRSDLGNILKAVLNKHPTKIELEAWFTFLSFESKCTMDLRKFTEAIGALKQFSSKPSDPVLYRSFDKMRVDWIKHKRVVYNPQHSLKRPLISSQEIGWHALKAGLHDTRFPHHATDVTINEGRNLADYYGHVTMM